MFTHYGKATTNPAKCGTTDSTNFPVFVSLSDNSLKTVANGGKVTSSSGFDVVFYSDLALTSALAFEIEKYDGVAGTWKGHVKVGTLSHTAGVDIYFGFGDASITSTQENKPGTWSNGFVSVIHYGDGTTLNLTDSVTGSTLTNLGGTAAAAGLVGAGAVDLDGVNNHGLYEAAVLSGYPITLEAWFVADTLANGKLFAGIEQVPLSGSAQCNIQLRSTGAVRISVGAQFATTTATVSTGTKHYVAGSASSEDNRAIYLDGGNKVSNNTAHTGSQGTWSNTLFGSEYFGSSTSGFVLDGRLDETRVSSVVRSDDWILSTYNTLNDPASFFTSITYAIPALASNSGDIAAASSFSGTAYWTGSNRALSIDVFIFSTTRTVTAMTYGGVACTFVGAQNSANGRIESWRILSNVGPAAGNNTLSVTLSGSAEFVVAWVNHNNIIQISPIEVFLGTSGVNSGSPTDASISITTLTDNSIVHFACISNDTSIVANQTSRNNVVAALGSAANEDPGAITHPVGSVTGSYTGLGTTASWAMVAYALRPSTAGATFKGRWFYDAPNSNL